MQLESAYCKTQNVLSSKANVTTKLQWFAPSRLVPIYLMIHICIFNIKMRNFDKYYATNRAQIDKILKELSKFKM